MYAGLESEGEAFPNREFHIVTSIRTQSLGMVETMKSVCFWEGHSTAVIEATLPLLHARLHRVRSGGEGVPNLICYRDTHKARKEGERVLELFQTFPELYIELWNSGKNWCFLLFFYPGCGQPRR